MVASIPKYSSQIWGFHRVKDIEVVHNRFCRFMLKLAKNLLITLFCGTLGNLPENMFICKEI